MNSIQLHCFFQDKNDYPCTFSSVVSRCGHLPNTASFDFKLLRGGAVV